MFEIDVSAIKEHIREQGIKQRAIANKLGIDEHKFCKILKGERKLSATEYVNICDAIGVPLEQFVTPNMQAKKELQANCGSVESEKFIPEDSNGKHYSTGTKTTWSFGN